MKYDFTGKERDDQTTYDYFGARYYDSHIANWTSIDPLFEKHFDHSPFNYVLRNPMLLLDPDGKQITFHWNDYDKDNANDAMKGDVAMSAGQDITALNEKYSPGTIEPNVYLPIALSWVFKSVKGLGEWQSQTKGAFLGNSDDIFANPKLLESETPQSVRKILNKEKGWIETPLSKGYNQGKGNSFNKLNKRGDDLGDKYIQFSPGGSSHHPDPYWKISSGQTGKIRINQQLAKDVWKNLGFK